ncbi:MAG: hypothetical protein LW832_10805, partial [Parachlamydia sp.]|nr:hypothetical protein [Parachlamydia sp.]
NLQKLKIFEIDCGALMASVNYDHQELIKLIREQIEGHENDVLFFIDGIDHLLKNPVAWRTFRKKFFEDQPAARFIATTTSKEMEKIEQNDEDGSFLSRVEKVYINDNNPLQCSLVLEEYLRHNAPQLEVSKEALEAAIELAQTENYLPHIGLPRKAIKILECAVARC